MEKTILVADDDPDVTQSLAVRLKRLGLSVVRSPDATHALVGTQRMRPALVILDVNMPGGNGLAVAEMLASDVEFCHLPVIVYTGRNDELTRIRCVHPNHYYVQKSPHSWNEIKTIVCKELGISAADAPDTAESAEAAVAVRAASGEADGPIAAAAAPVSANAATPEALAPRYAVDGSEDGGCDEPDATRNGKTKCPKALCIDDDPDISKAIKLRLAGYGVDVLRAFNGMQGYWTAVSEQPDVIICDMSMPDGDGNYIISRFKSHPLTENIPVIVLTGLTNPALKRNMVTLGAAAYLDKPLVFEDLLQHLRAFLNLPEQPKRTRYERVIGV